MHASQQYPQVPAADGVNDHRRRWQHSPAPGLQRLELTTWATTPPQANLVMGNREIDGVRHLDMQPGSGNGIRFWSSDAYKISMGNTA